LAVVLVASAFAIVEHPATPPATAAGEGVHFVETFDGAPPSPTPWKPANWDVTVHSRDNDRWTSLDPMMAEHGPDCGPPPATHAHSSYEGAVFQCRDHMMTAINATGYGAVYLTPDHMADFSKGTSTISVDVSTLRSASNRDWWDVWITPFGDNLQLPGEDWYPDLDGYPRNGVLVSMYDGVMTASIIKDFKKVQFSQFPFDKLPGDTYTKYDTFLTQSARQRETFQIHISRTHIRVGMPKYNFWWIDTPVPDLGFDTGVVQFGHHSYNPTKDCGSTNHPGPDGTCKPGTWHWDNVSINPATPFTLLRGSNRDATAASPTVTLPAPAPPNSYLRFVGIGDNLQFSTDNGATWRTPTEQARDLSVSPERVQHFNSHWTPIPQGTRTIRFRGTSTWAGDWHVMDTSVWSWFDAPAVNVPAVGNSREYVAVTPARLLESRSGLRTVDNRSNGIGIRPAGSTTELVVVGRGSVATTAKAVTLNVAAIAPTSGGYLTVYPCGRSRPAVAQVTYSAGRTTAGSVTSAPGSGGKVCIYSSGRVHLAADVSGFAPSTSSFIPATGSRFMETRRNASRTVDGSFFGAGTLRAGTTTQLTIAGRPGVPGNAAAAALVLTAVSPRAGGYVTVYPCGTTRPTASSLNAQNGRTTSNSTVVRLGTSGRVCVYNSMATDLVVDIVGYYPATTPMAMLQPARLLETRPGANTVDGRFRGIGRRAAGSTTTFTVSTRGAVPINAAAVNLNVTAVAPSGPGYLTVYPCGTARPAASSINYSVDQTVSNMVLTKIGTNGTVCVYTSASTHVVVDVSGAYIGT
jgi:hypothetical protein